MDLIGKGGPILLVPSGLLNRSNLVVFMPVCDGFWFHFWYTRLRRFHELFVVVPLLLASAKPSGIASSSELEFLGFFEKTPILLDVSSNSQDLLIFRTRSLRDMFTG